MKTRDLVAIGIPAGRPAETAKQILQKAQSEKRGMTAVLGELGRVAASPADFLDDQRWAGLAQLLLERGTAERTFVPRDAPYRIWGENLDSTAVDQLKNACKLPVAVAAALMPDAHVGYGLPIGGVLATRDAIIPYAVGVDIACRMKLTVLDLPVHTLATDVSHLTRTIERETRFGMGASFEMRRQHDVMDADWRVSNVTARMKDRAWAQLGTSGSGNHFVEFGQLTVLDAASGLAPGTYLALLSHSGSRGTGAQVADHYSRLARERHPELPKALSHLAWLELSSEAGQEYWAAMELMGRYAAANHALIHAHIRARARCRGAARHRKPP
jgi:tRNA-splicing ligase RtcB